MKTKLTSILAVALCAIAILVDFTSKVMSIAVDGILLGIVIAIIVSLSKNKDEDKPS